VKVPISFPPTLTVDDVLSRLEGLEECGPGQWLSWCPAHDDTGSSMKGLSITERDGRVLLFCHSGCGFGEIVDALAETEPHPVVIEPPTQLGKRMGSEFGWTATYNYTDGRRVLFAVVRYEDGRGNKTFRTRRYLPGEVIYRLPEVVEAIERGEPVYLVEGEKDVHAIEAAGGVATTNAHGALRWTPEHAEFLRGAHVIVVADDDTAGWRRVRQVVDSLAGVAASVRVVEAAHGKDAFDHLEAGYSLDGFMEVG
jgi:5S rRNA maturation endonuclease (ribonuclease M5)